MNTTGRPGTMWRKNNDDANGRTDTAGGLTNVSDSTQIVFTVIRNIIFISRGRYRYGKAYVSAIIKTYKPSPKRYLISKLMTTK